MKMGTKLTIATSIAPQNIDQQARAIKSWLNLGFDVVSINCAEEILTLQQSFPDVRFIQAKRDAKEVYGKPLIYFDEFLDYFSKAEYEFCGIVNSDVYLQCNEDNISFIKSQLNNSLVYGSRIDVHRPEDLAGKVYRNGFDFFFFDKSLISCFPRSDFCIGMPWWDYWVPLMAALQGFTIKKLISPFAYHIKHIFRWSILQWGNLAKALFRHLREGIENNFNADLDENPWALLGRIFAVQHNQYLEDKGLEDRSKMSVGIIFPSVVEFLEAKSLEIGFDDDSPKKTPDTFPRSEKEQYDTNCDVSIVLCTKDRADLLDQTLISLKEAAEGINYEIIVVKGDSSDNTIAVLHKHDISSIYNESECLGAGRHSWPQLYNFGFSKARGKWAMYASDDIIFGPGCICRAVEVLEKQNGNVAGGIFFYKNAYSTNPQWADYGIDFTYGAKLLMNYGLVRLDCFKEVGGLDEDYRFYCADTDFCYKLYQKGMRLIPLPGCLITHNNILDAQRQANLQVSDTDIKLLLQRWRHFVPTELPNPRRLMWREEITENVLIAGPDSSQRTNTVGLIFSKDRAMQLQAVIDSFFLHCGDSDRLKLFILYKTTNDLHRRQYEKLIDKYPNISFIKETDFREQVLTVLKGFEYVLFLVDDNLFVRDFCLADIIKNLKTNPDAIGFSLRLGRNTNYCYPRDTGQSLPAFEQLDDGILRYDWTRAEIDFGYPLELSSSAYRTRDIAALLERFVFDNPNILEELMAANAGLYAQTHRNLLCYDSSVAFCNPVNKVQNIYNNRTGTDHRYTLDNLADMFEKGVRIAVERYSGFVPNACHQETELYFKDLPAITQESKDLQPEFSIITANYNNGKYISQAIESVLNQTFENWELIIVEDCSTDNSLEVINRFLNDSRIKLIRHEKNRGYTAALKTGIANVRSEYFGILDADDCLLPQAVETMYEQHIKFPECGLIYSQFEFCDENLAPTKTGFCDEIAVGNTTLDANVVSHFKTFKIRDYLKTEGYDENILYAEDIDVTYKMEEVTRLKFVDRCLYLYRELPNSIGHSKDKINVAIMSRVRARINALIRRCRASAEFADRSFGELFRESIRNARADHQDVEQYFVMLEDLYQKGALSDLNLPEEIGNCSAEDRQLWMAANISIEFDRFFRHLKEQEMVKTEPLVTVEMITCNAERFIGKAIESVLAQTYLNFELLIVDDGSTDNTAGIIGSYSDDRLRYIYKEHANPASTRNRAIAEARGKYLLCVDSDDFIEPDYIEKMIAYAQNHPEVDYFYPAKLTLVNESGDCVGVDWDYLNFADGSVLAAFIFDNGFGPIPNPGSLKRRSLFDRVGIYDELDCVEDFAFLCKNAEKIKFMRVDDHSRYFYRRLPDSNSLKFEARNRIMADVLNEMVSLYRPQVLCPQIADIAEPAVRQQRYYEYLIETFEKHAVGPMVKYDRYFRQYADYYRTKLLEITGRRQIVDSAVKLTADKNLYQTT